MNWKFNGLPCTISMPVSGLPLAGRPGTFRPRRSGWALLFLALVAGGCGSPPPVDYDMERENEPGIVDLIDPAAPVPVERFLKPYLSFHLRDISETVVQSNSVSR